MDKDVEIARLWADKVRLYQEMMRFQAEAEAAQQRVTALRAFVDARGTNRDYWEARAKAAEADAADAYRKGFEACRERAVRTLNMQMVEEREVIPLIAALTPEDRP